jgi:micrococcal nuclease
MARLVSRRKLNRLLISLVLGIIAALISTQTSVVKNSSHSIIQNDPGLYSVSRFVDGDTIDVDMGGHNETVRFIGMDTPETHKPNTPVQCYGQEAAAYTKQLIGTNRVRLQADPLDTNRDRYGRLLRYVYLPDGTLVEAKLISEGYAFAYTLFPFQKKDEFKALEAQAKTSGKGLWSACQVHVESGGKEQTQ